MATPLTKPRLSSIAKKQIVAVTGLLMVGFILGHLAGNTLIFAGHESFNHYAEMLQSLGEFLWVVRFGLITALVCHVYFTIRITLENRQARGQRYDVDVRETGNTFAKRTMIYTGVLLFLFLCMHLSDFTLADKEGSVTVVEAAGETELGLYGVVWNKFSNPFFSFLYVVAVCSVGFHLSHGIQSLCQTIGLNHDRYTPWIQRISLALGALVAIGFSSIPLFVLVTRVPSL